MAAKTRTGRSTAKTDAVLDKLTVKRSVAEQRSDLKTVAHKTVAIFSGIVGRKLILRHEDIDFGCRTDGRVVAVDTTSEDFYRDVEQGLAHIVFDTKFKVLNAFVDEYFKRIQVSIKKRDLFAKLSEYRGSTATPEKLLERLRSGLSRLVSILEAHRVESLWGAIYAGSYRAMRARRRKQLSSFQPVVHDSIVLYFLSVSYGLDVEPGQLDVFKPCCVEALKKVAGRSFQATLVISKWLLTCLVDQLQNETAFRSVCRNLSCWEGDDPNYGGTEAPSEADFDSLDTSRLCVEERSVSSPEKRISALGSLSELMAIPSRLESLVDIFELGGKGWGKECCSLVNAALDSDVRSKEKLRECLELFKTEADFSLAGIQEKLGTCSQQLPIIDDWVLKGCMAKVEFSDVTKADTLGKTCESLLLDDASTVNKLKTLFQRVLGRRRVELQDTGTQIDLEACIARRISNENVPCFQHEARGRGFKALVLLDRSGSMEGVKTEQAERACRIVKKALTFPFVDLRVWGFQSLDLGQVHISRFAPDLEVFDSHSSIIGGSTPLHVAIRVATRWLDSGSDAKHLVVITDGQPVYQLAGGQHISGAQLKRWVRESVKAARCNGICVSAVLIGRKGSEPLETLSAKELSFMFGSRAFWSCVCPDRLGDSLIKLVSSSFVKYLRNL